MVIPEQLAGYKAGWEESRKKRKQELRTRYNRARKCAQKAVEHLKRNYHCRVYLFGTLTRKEAFTDSSDIDIAVSGLDRGANFWKMYSEVMDILAPFDFDLVELEKIEPGLRKHILKEGEKM